MKNRESSIVSKENYNNADNRQPDLGYENVSEAYKSAAESPTPKNIALYTSEMMKDLGAYAAKEGFEEGSYSNLVAIKESIDYTIDNFDEWGDSSNPTGEAALYKLFGTVPAAMYVMYENQSNEVEA